MCISRIQLSKVILIFCYQGAIEDVVLCIAHRGRLNLLTLLMEYPPVEIFQKVWLKGKEEEMKINNNNKKKKKEKEIEKKIIGKEIKSFTSF